MVNINEKKEFQDFNEISDGRIIKMEVDCSDKADKAITMAKSSVNAGHLTKALDTLYNVEKESRIYADMRSNARIQLEIVEACVKAKDWNTLCDNIVILTKKRSLIKQATTNMIQKCCSYVEKTPNRETCLKLIETVRTVSAGKIYLEVERARLTFKLSKMLEEEGKLDEATTCLLELQIETFGSMDKQEKVEILLEQMRLCLARKDYVRAQIISRKVSVKVFDDQSIQMQNLKLKYYQLMISLDQTEENYLAICRHFLAISRTDIIEQDQIRMEEVLRNVILYVILARHSNEQSDLMFRIRENKNLDKIQAYKDLLNLFIQQELISWNSDIVQKYEELIRKGTKSSPATDVFSPATDVGKKQWDNLKTRVGEHNIRMIAKYYSRVSLKRLANLLDWPQDKTESFLCQMIVDGTIEHAKVDRPAGLVSFKALKTPAELLDDWNVNLGCMMEKLNKACHLIAKEEMVHKHLHATTTK